MKVDGLASHLFDMLRWVSGFRAAQLHVPPIAVGLPALEAAPSLASATAKT